MSASRETFAQAERLAHFTIDTFKASPMTVLETLIGWRDRYGIALSDGALALVVAHVCDTTAPLRRDAAA